MYKEQIIIIRHARTYSNIRASHDPDASLTTFGFEQAVRLAEFLHKHVSIFSSRWYTSPFLRCLQTAGCIQQRVGIAFGVDRRLREYINHSYDKVEIPTRVGEYPEFDWPRDAKEVFKQESNEEFLNRIIAFHDALPDRSVVVTHGMPALTLSQVASRNINAVPVWDHSIDNASVTLVRGGRVVWHGRNLYHELDYDPFDKKRSYDGADFVF